MHSYWKRGSADDGKRRNRPYYKVGDVICTEGDCAIGKTLVLEMVNTYASHIANLSGQNLIDFKARFQAPVTAIHKTWKALDDSWGRQIPFSPICCSIKIQGDKAQKITQAMNAWAGAETPAQIDTPGPTTAEGGMNKILIIAGIFGGLILLPPIIGAFKGR